MAIQTQILDINFNNPTFKMVGGMTLDDIKIKYGWFLNAEVNNAIIGEDKNGLVWYNGDWLGGIWENGTWYSGNFYNGRWKKGNWYSYDINIEEALKGNLVINKTDISKSKFISGTWDDGIFNYGIFGSIKLKNNIQIPTEISLDFILNNIDDYIISSSYIFFDIINDQTLIIENPRFLNGQFINGLINAAKIEGGNFMNGFINNSVWENGTFNNGIFLGDYWLNGYFRGGDFSNGIWKNGNLISTQKNILTRFGVNYKNKEVIWENGIFNNGQFHSTLNLLNNEPIPSIDNDYVHWENGVWENGIWYGGTFESGEWLSGTFLNGVILDINWKKGHFKDGFWKNGTMEGGTVSGGIFENIICNNGNLGFDI